MSRIAGPLSQITSMEFLLGGSAGESVLRRPIRGSASEAAHQIVARDGVRGSRFDAEGLGGLHGDHIGIGQHSLCVFTSYFSDYTPNLTCLNLQGSSAVELGAK